MKIKRLGLVNDLAKVLPGIGTGTTTIEGCDTVLFHEGNIYTYNTLISVMTKDTQETGLSGVVNAKDFYDCLVKLPSEEIEIEPKKEGWQIKDGKIKVNVKLLSMVDLERFNALKSDEPWVEIDGKELNDSLRMSIIKKNKVQMDGVYLNGSIVMSTNQFVINKCNGKNEYDTCFVSRSCAEQIIKWEGFTEMRIRKSWLQLSSDDTIFAVRLLSVDDFPIETVNETLDKICAFEKVCDINLTDKFFLGCERATSFSDKMDEQYVVSVTFGKETSISSAKNSGSYSEIIDDVSVDTENLVINFDVEVLSVLKAYFRDISIHQNNGKYFIIAHNDRCMKMFSNIIA